MKYEDKISVIKGIGEKTEKLLHGLGIRRVTDLLEYYPRMYDVYDKIKPIREVRPETVVTIEGFITDSIQLKKVRKLNILSCRLKDDTDSIMVTWFNMPYLTGMIKLGSRHILRGKVSIKNGILTLEQPKILSKEEYLKKLGGMVPIYPLTAGLTNTTLTKSMELALKELEWEEDHLPAAIRKKYQLTDYKKAIRNIHFPKNQEEMKEARKRLVFDEFFIFSLALAKLKENKHQDSNSFPVTNTNMYEKVKGILPYELTKAQQKTIEEVIKDLSGPYTMNRLIQGDVGSGKTIVAAISMLIMADQGAQSVIMVPTEVLAKQHYEELKNLARAFDKKVGLLTGSMTAKEKKTVYQQIKDHELDLIVGTHALIQEKVEYDNLGLVVTDEQHRFGVRQREELAKKGNKPHVLVMSATPIPRTLAIILYGDLDVSIIDELPSNRLAIKNCVVNTSYRDTAYRFISEQVGKGRQVYIICPMVEESESIEVENVTEYVEKLRMDIPPFIQIEGLHGKMKPKEKNEIMERFLDNEIHVLISTTVIEVGVNVPNATVMMIENAERFGLAQLHQLRGRVGRGSYQSYCIFMSGAESKEIRQRLEILNKSNDGFYVAEEDLKLRGPGDLFGIRQSGELGFVLADVFADASVLKDASEGAKEIKMEEIVKMMESNGNVRRKIVNYTGTTIL